MAQRQARVLQKQQRPVPLLCVRAASRALPAWPARASRLALTAGETASGGTRLRPGGLGDGTLEPAGSGTRGSGRAGAALTPALEALEHLLLEIAAVIIGDLGVGDLGDDVAQSTAPARRGVRGWRNPCPSVSARHSTVRQRQRLRPAACPSPRRRFGR